MKKEKRDYNLAGAGKESLRIAGIYLFLGFLWILFSDKLLDSLATDPAMITKLQTYKGWFFVSASAFLIFFLVYKRAAIINQAFNDLRNSVYKDPLTGLPSKAAFLKNMEDLSAEARAYSIAYIDLDNFRFINDTLGHKAGDKFLTYVASELGSLKKDNEYLARLDGDEFGLLIPGNNKKEFLDRRLDEIFGSFDRYWQEGNHQFFTSFTMGLASWPKDGATSFEIYKNANIALNRGKKAGKKVRIFFEDVEISSVTERARLASDLQKAMDNEELFLYYQPLHDLRTLEIGGMEALLRWKKDDEAFISPSEFIPIAEETGQILALDRWVLRRVLEEKGRLEKKNLFWELGINLSSKTLMNDLHFPLYLDIFDQYEVDLSGIIIEITETAIIDNMDLAIKRIEALKAKGVMLALDDFGTGYSSLTHLKLLPIDTIKIDRAFTAFILGENKEGVIIQSLIHMCDKMGLRIVAEGIENEEQLVYLRDNGCMIGQGFYLSRPDYMEKHF